MGDSDITLYLSVVALLVVVGAIIAFVVALRVRQRAVRFGVGVILLVVAAVCAILSILATLLVAALGVYALILASKTPRGRRWKPNGRATNDVDAI
jgi:hypothetical protein